MNELEEATKQMRKFQKEYFRTRTGEALRLAKEAEKRVDELLAKADATPQPTLFDESAFDAAVEKPNGWSEVADPVAEIRRMRGDEQPGNAAALRSVLMEACDIIRCYDMAEADGSFANQGEEVGDWFAKAEAALAAPARNCDVGTTEEQEKRFDAFCDSHKWVDDDGVNACLSDCPLYKTVDCALHWAQMPFAPAEGGAE